MREKLRNYVELLFAGTTGTEEMQQEILQNTLDRYDDLIAQGKTPEEAYRQAVAGIGDIETLLGNQQESAPSVEIPQTAYVSMGKRICDAVAVALYILSPVPCFCSRMHWGCAACWEWSPAALRSRLWPGK